MNTVPNLVETNDLNVAVIVQAGTTIFTRTSNNENFPFRSIKYHRNLSVDDVKSLIDNMGSYSGFLAYRVNDPNYIPPIPNGTVLYDVSYGKESVDRNGDTIAAGAWTPAIHYDNTGSFSSWKDIINNTVFYFSDVVSFRYGKGSNEFTVKHDGTISGTFEGVRGLIKFKNINDFIRCVNSGEVSIS